MRFQDDENYQSYLSRRDDFDEDEPQPVVWGPDGDLPPYFDVGCHHHDIKFSVKLLSRAVSPRIYIFVAMIVQYYWSETQVCIHCFTLTFFQFNCLNLTFLPLNFLHSSVFGKPSCSQKLLRFPPFPLSLSQLLFSHFNSPHFDFSNCISPTCASVRVTPASYADGLGMFFSPNLGNIKA